MPHISRVDLGHAFCSYCGYPPMGPWRVRAHRVCMRCQMGVVLKAPAGAEPRYDDPFVIVDRKLAVQAVSRHAEAALSVEEPASLDAPLEEFLICNDGDHDRGELAALVELAFAGTEPSNTLELRPVANPGTRLQARITSCGPPLGAMLILTPLAVHASPSARGRPGADRNLTAVAPTGRYERARTPGLRACIRRTDSSPATGRRGP
jgi:hypothetical protein